MSKMNLMQIDNFLPYMRDVVRCEQSLHELNLMWRIIESSAKMNCPTEASAILPTMATTRESFSRLESELVFSLVQQKVSTVLGEIGTKAQYVIDILVRNLYERTADVGFLATDKELCTFVAGLHNNVDAIRYRLRAYRSKYTVYDEIILLDVNGNVLVQIDQETPIEGSLDPLVAETLRSDQYVETYRASDLRPAKDKALIYSKRMHHPDTGAVVGVLCLCFNFTQEMAGIFKSHADATGRAIMLLLDSDNRVIEASDPLWIPVGATVPVNHEGGSGLMMYAGREYLVRTFSAEGYQGYVGPKGWKGQVMVPVDIAFTGQLSNALENLDTTVAEGLLSHAQSFCPPLYEIMHAAENIRRVVWNGQVMTAGHEGELLKLKTVLDQISETGARSNDLFSQSINDLYETVLSSRLKDAEFVSNLLVDLLDRNLYERSDDCRWWALTPQLRAALAAAVIDTETTDKITDILEYINALYTVYTRIFVYDSTGRIIACTNAADTDDSVLGTKIEDDTLTQVMSLRTEQQYYVTPFEPNPLYDNTPTYVYHAAIMAPEDGRAVGGIGIVFDAGPEFLAMLRSGIAGKEAVNAFYVDRNGKIISSTDPSRPIGSILDLDTDLLDLPNGKSASRIVIHDGHYCILGCSVSNGYREFKVTDGYKEDVIAVVFDSFGEVRSRPALGSNASVMIENNAGKHGGVEFATFSINGGLFAIEAAHVTEALAASEISPITIGSRSERIGVLSVQDENNTRAYAWVYDLGYLLSGTPTDKNLNGQVVVIKYGEHKVGLLVEALHTVAEFNNNHINGTPLPADKSGALVKQIIKANGGNLLIQSIDVAYLLRMLTNPFEQPEVELEAA